MLSTKAGPSSPSLSTPRRNNWRGWRRNRRRHGPEAMPELVDRLYDLADGRDCVSIEMLVRTIGAQGHAPLLLIAGLFMILPIGMIPGVGGALGLLVAIIGLQMLLGRNGVSIPRFFGKREISADRIRNLAEQVRPVFEWLRRRLKIRMEYLSAGKVSLSIIAVILIITGGSLLVLGAIPVVVPMMGLPIILFAFGLFARDGAVVAAGYALILIACVVIFLLHRNLAG